jgi:hypothetical protein
MARIDDIKVRAYEVANAELLTLLNRRIGIQADLTKNDADIAKVQADIIAMQTGFKASIEAAKAVAIEGEVIAE